MESNGRSYLYPMIQWDMMDKWSGTHTVLNWMAHLPHIVQWDM